MTSRSISVLVHADSKVGKSTLGNSTPAPRLILDAEAAYRFLPGTKVMWDPLTQAPPLPPENGEWETCVVLIRDYGTMIKTYEWLNSGQHPFRSVTIDSISEIQTKCKDDLTADGRMTMQLWGDLLTHMERLVRQFRDLTEHPTKPLEAVVMTAMTEARDGKYKPYVQGQLRTKLPYFLDVIMYMYVEEVPSADPTQPATRVRRGLTVNHPQFEAGERVQGRLPAVLDNPRIDTMLDLVFPPQQVAATDQS